MGWASRRRQEQRRNTASHRSHPESRRPQEDLRLSERLVDLVAPYREDRLTSDRYEMLIGAAATAWNLSLLSEPERPDALRQAFRKARVKDVEAASDMIVTLMRRKEHCFPTIIELSSAGLDVCRRQALVVELCPLRAATLGPIAKGCHLRAFAQFAAGRGHSSARRFLVRYADCTCGCACICERGPNAAARTPRRELCVLQRPWLT